MIPLLGLDHGLFDGEFKLSFGGEIYAGIGGGGYVYMNLSELGKIAENQIKKYFGCDSQW